MADVDPFIRVNSMEPMEYVCVRVCVHARASLCVLLFVWSSPSHNNALPSGSYSDIVHYHASFYHTRSLAHSRSLSYTQKHMQIHTQHASLRYTESMA